MPHSSAITSRTWLLAAFAIGAALIVALTIGNGAGPPAANAADHLDAPDLTSPGGNGMLDINDVYAFQSRPGYTALIMTVNPATPAATQGQFASTIPRVGKDRKVRYTFHVDTNGNARPNINITVRFGKPNANGVQRMVMRRNGKVIARGKTSAFGKTRILSGRKGTQAFAGTVDHPFFLDLNGFINLTTPLDTDPSNDSDSFLGCTSARPDFFAGLNASAIVLEVRNSMLTGRRGDSNIAVWGTTKIGRKQIDRMGRPTINTLFLPANPVEADEASMKNRFNRSRPHRDRANFKPEVVDSLETLFSLNDAGGPLGGSDDPSDDAGQIDGLANTLLPDLTIDVSNPAGFLNGRGLGDDVIDAELALVTEGLFGTDCVDANDVPFRTSFPWVAAPH